MIKHRRFTHNYITYSWGLLCSEIKVPHPIPATKQIVWWCCCLYDLELSLQPHILSLETIPYYDMVKCLSVKCLINWIQYTITAISIQTNEEPYLICGFRGMIWHTFSWQTDGLIDWGKEGMKLMHKLPFQSFNAQATSNIGT